MNFGRASRGAIRVVTAGLLLGALGGAATAGGAPTPAATHAKPAPATRPAAAGRAPTSRAAHIAPLTLDSLKTDDSPRAFLAAPDAQTLAALRRETDYAAGQFRRSIGPYPPKISVAALGSLPDPARVNPAALHAAGIDHVVMDWPARAGSSRAMAGGAAATGAAAGSARPALDGAVAAASLAERASRWYLLAYERKQSRGTPLPGKTRFVPDWFESALSGLAALPGEQNRRVAWMRERIDQRIPMEKFLEMTRPVAGAASNPASGGKPGARKNPGAAGTGATATGVDSTQLFEAQALSFARFLDEREHERFLGFLLEILLTGKPQSAAFNIAKTFLPRPDMIEQEWVAWVNQSAPPSGAR